MEQNLIMALGEILLEVFMPLILMFGAYIVLLTSPQLNKKKYNKRVKKHSLLTRLLIYSIRNSRVSKYKEQQRAIKKEQKKLERQQQKIQEMHNKKANSTANTTSCKVIQLSELRKVN